MREIKEKEITYQWIMAYEMTHSVMAIIPKQETEIKERLLIHSQPTAARLPSLTVDSQACWNSWLMLLVYERSCVHQQSTIKEFCLQPTAPELMLWVQKEKREKRKKEKKETKRKKTKEETFEGSRS